MVLACTALALVLAAAPGPGSPPPSPALAPAPEVASPAPTAAMTPAAVAPESEGLPAVADLMPQVVIGSHLYEGEFQAVNGVYCDPVSGEIYVADTGNETIGIFDARGAPLFAFRDEEHLSQPVRVITDRKGRILVLDNDRAKVKVYGYRGNYLGNLELEGVTLGDKEGFAAMAFDPQGNFYLATSTEVMVFDPAMRLQSRFGKAGDREGEFKSIVSLAADGNLVYVADREALAVQVFDRGSGKYLRGWGHHQTGKQNVSLPHGIAVDARGRIILLDMLRQEIKYYQSNGTYLDSFGGIGRAPGEVSFPSDLSLDAKGRLCVADRGNDRIQVLAAVERSEMAKQGGGIEAGKEAH